MNAHAHSDSRARTDFSPCAGARADSARLADLLRREHVAMADFLVALADFDQRRRWRDLGHASLFSYLHVELGVSKGAAHYRKVAVDLVQRFPEVVEPLRDGRICITSVVELARVLTAENRGEVLPRFFHRSRREAQALAAAIRPDEAPARREVVTAVRQLAPARLDGDAAGSCVDAGLPATQSRPVQPAELGATSTSDELNSSSTAAHPEPFDSASPARGYAPDRLRAEGPESRETSTPKSAPPSTAPRTTSVPLTADLHRLHITVSRRFLDKLEAARAALSHSHPGADAERILEEGLDLLLERAARRRGLVRKPRPAPGPGRRFERREEVAPATLEAGTDGAARSTTPDLDPTPVPADVPAPGHLPAHVRRAVWLRDGGRCQWPLAAGGTCGSTLRLELDHLVPRARGGPSTVDNLRVICRFHNDEAARLEFGDEWMDRFTGRKAPAFVEGRTTGDPLPSGSAAELR